MRPSIIDTGTYLETWYKSGRKRRMIRRIWSSNLLPAAPLVAPTPLK